jgi:uncharacterized protein (TIGR00730 family)
MQIFGSKSSQQTKDICRLPLTADERDMCKQAGIQPNMSDLTWRIFRIMAEFVEGFQFLSSLDKEVTIFGSARLRPDNKWYQEAVKLGYLLGSHEYTVVTGGGPGIMEAANKGAYDAGGESVGLNIQLPEEQRVNPFVKRSRAFHYFFTRKVALAASAQAYVYFPGGFGTMDEFFEIITLIQTEKSEQIPIVLVGKEYWEGLLAWVKETMFEEFEAISREDFKLFTLVDSAEEAFEIIKTSSERSLF